MAQIGNLGKLIVFEVSSDKVLTFNDMQQSVKGRWTQHTVIGKKPVSEFLGADLRTLSFKVRLDANHGVKPRKTLKKIEKAVEKGTPYIFVLNGAKVGKNEWVISSASETWDKILSHGELVSCSITLSLTEYVGG